MPGEAILSRRAGACMGCWCPRLLHPTPPTQRMATERPSWWVSSHRTDQLGTNRPRTVACARGLCGVPPMGSGGHGRRDPGLPPPNLHSGEVVEEEEGQAAGSYHRINIRDSLLEPSDLRHIQSATVLLPAVEDGLGLHRCFPPRPGPVPESLRPPPGGWDPGQTVRMPHSVSAPPSARLSDRCSRSLPARGKLRRTCPQTPWPYGYQAFHSHSMLSIPCRTRPMGCVRQTRAGAGEGAWCSA